MKKTTIKSAGQKPVIELVDLVKEYGNKTVLQELNMSINKGEFITLLGASGSGKTTALRLIAGFEYPTRGEIRFNGIDVKDLPANKRPTNTVFQDYALFPHLNVEGNIKYGIKLFRTPKENIKPEITKRLAKLQKEWAKKAEQAKKKLDKEQAEYNKILEKEKPTSGKFKKAQRWYDKSDYSYSYWESYVQQRTEAFNHKYTMRPLTKAEIKAKVAKMIEMVGLQGSEKKAIDQLSGGMKQRVAIARSLILEPTVLLLDEPLSALDAKIRQRMQKDLRKLQRQLGITFIFVTHDQEEAMVMSDRVAVMREGRIEQFASPKELYDYPVNAWVASFIGDSSQFKGKYIKKGSVEFMGKTFKCEPYEIPAGSKVDIMLRPEDFEIAKGHKKTAYINGHITRRTFQGAMWEYRVHGDNGVKVTVETNKTMEIGQEVAITWDFMDLHVMPAEVKAAEVQHEK